MLSGLKKNGIKGNKVHKISEIKVLFGESEVDV